MTALLNPPPETEPTPAPPASRSGIERGRTAVAGHLATPLARAGLALVASAGITSLLGLLYWSLAARRYSPAAIGATAALLAAMEVVAAIANLGLRTSLIRFVPALGDRAARVVAVSYAVAGLVALAGAGIFVAVHGRWFPELDLLDHASGAGFFLLASVLWVVFALQDSVLVSLRRSSWVPVENGVYALAKLALLIGLTAPMPRWGVYVSWTAPLLAMVLVVNIPIFLELRRPRPKPTETLTVRDLVRFSAGDYAASVLWLLTIDALPLLVVGLSGPTDGAWYHLAWTVAYTLYLVASAVGQALLAEAAHSPAALEIHARRALAQGLAIVVPAVLVVAVAAPWLLRLFGADYATAGTTLLQLLALSAVPHVVTSVYVTMGRARRQVGRVFALYAVLGAGVVGTSALLMPHLGVTGVGVAWLGTQTAVALWLLATRLRDLWLAGLPTPVIRILGSPARLRQQAAQRRRAATVVPQVLGTRGLGDADWEVVHATADLVVARIHPDGGPPALMLKLPGSVEAEQGRRQERANLAALEADPRMIAARLPVPLTIDHGTRGSQPWSLETALPGRTARAALDEGLAPDVLLTGAAFALGRLHQATAHHIVVDDDRLATWVDEPIAVVAAACPEVAPGLDQIAATLHAALRGEPAVVAWAHGDAAPGNLLLGRDDAVAGIVDWESARPDRLPEVDLVTLVLSVRAESATAEFGEVVPALLERPWTEEEVAVLGSGPNPHLSRDALVLLAWLHHVTINLTKSEAYATNRVWLLRNVVAVAAGGPTITGTGAGPPAGADLEDPDRTVTAAPVTAAPAEPVGTIEPVQSSLPLTMAEPTARRWPAWAAFLVPVVATAGWALGLAGADPRALTDIGLVSLVGPVGFLALALLVGGFAMAVIARPPREGVMASYLGALLLVIHATPALVYGTVRYSWAWKHIGIVDYIDRTGHVDPGIDVLPVYHNWPGFFTGSHLLQEWVGADDVITIARWAPLVLGVATVAAVVMVVATFTTDRRVVWLSAWLFCLGNWVGQEYFSPQAFAYLLYLVAVTLAVRLARTPHPIAATVVTVTLLAAAIASSHQITPAMLTVAFIALAVTRQARVGALAVVAVVGTVTWALWGAAAYVGQNLIDLVEGFGQPLGNAEGNLTAAGRLSDGQVLVVQAGRLAVVGLAGLAAIGLIRRWWRGQRDLAPLVLLLAPLVILAVNDFDGEILFRVFLFGLPFAAFFAAHALVDPPVLRGRAVALVPFVVSLGLLAGFLVAHYGKDGHYVFTPEEVRAATWLYESAPDGSLLVEGSRNYPTQFRNYEHFRYVPLDREPLSARREMARWPVRTLVRWMSDPRDAASYLLITRSQQREADVMGFRPVGFLTGLEADLRASNRFTVAYENRDAVIFTLTERGR